MPEETGMLSSTIALNRFGLGGRPSDQPATDPKRWLLGQFDRFQPRPQAFADVPSRPQVVAQLADYLAAQQMAARAKRQIQPASLPTGAAAQQQQPDPQMDADKRYFRQSIRQDYLVMNAARLDSALTTDTPFVERLVSFWANHFAVSVD